MMYFREWQCFLVRAYSVSSFCPGLNIFNNVNVMDNPTEHNMALTHTELLSLLQESQMSKSKVKQSLVSLQFFTVPHFLICCMQSIQSTRISRAKTKLHYYFSKEIAIVKHARFPPKGTELKNSAASRKFGHIYNIYKDVFNLKMYTEVTKKF